MTKAALRSQYHARRQALSDEEYAARNERIFQHFQQYFSVRKSLREPFRETLTIHCFLSSPQKREADTAPLIRYFLSQPSVTVVVPCSHSDFRLTHHCFTEETVLETNRWGIREPHPPGPAVAVVQIDWVLVPLLVLDVRGYRVGYGKGFYDRFLAQCRPDTLKIGLSLEDPIDHIDDVDEYDIPLDYGITPAQVWKFPRN